MSESDSSSEDIFSETDLVQASSQLIQNLYFNKRQEMKVRILEAKNELEPELQQDQLVCIIGEPGPPVSKEPVRPLLSVRNSWLRVHNKKWVLGTTLLNTSQSETVSLSTPAVLTVPWLPVSVTPHYLSWVEDAAEPLDAGPSRPKRSRAAGAWRSLNQLPPGALAHALSVIDVDLSWPDSVLVKQGFQFTVNGVNDGVTSAQELTALGSKDPARRVFPLGAAHAASPASSSTQTVLGSTPGAPAQLDLAPDILSVQVTSELMELLVRAPETVNLRGKLTKKLGFETAAPTASRSFLMHRGVRSPLLKGIMLKVKPEPLDPSAYKLDVFTRDAAQSERFLRAILALPEVTVSAVPPPPDVKVKLAQALRLEQRFVQTQLARMLRETEISEERFRRFRLRLSQIELATDRLALGART